jgi:DNA polymerase III delta subunit
MGAAKEEYAKWAPLLHAERESEKTFIIISDTLAPHKNFKFLLEKPVQTQYFPELSGRDLETFLLIVAKKEALSFSPEGWRAFLLALRTFGDGAGKMWRAVFELKKLSLLAHGGIIDADAIHQGIHFSQIRDFYGLTREVLSGRTLGARLFAVEELSAGNFDAGWIFNTLCFLAKGKETLLLADADISIKSGTLDYETAITRVALR